MANNDFWNDVVVPFITNLLAWVFGVAITFGGQAQIDKRNDLEGIDVGLNMVTKELASNIEDLQRVHKDILSFSNSAKYLYDHIDNLRSCPADSVHFHWDNLNTEYYLSLSEDALTMLESTYLSSDLLDREVSISVVRAYDICETLERYINSICEHRVAGIEKVEDFFMMQADSGKGRLDEVTMISSQLSRKTLQRVMAQNGFWIDDAIMEIENIISVIDDYVKD